MDNKCYKCGMPYSGWGSCPICSVKEHLEQQQEDLQDSIRESTEEQQSAINESLEKQEEMLSEQREAIKEAQEETEYALQEASKRHKKTVSEAWKLQSFAKTERACELYKVELFDEAIKLCFEAISQDPGNISAYRIAAWSFEKTGQNAKARDMLKKRISLLRMSQYSNSSIIALEVLKDILEEVFKQGNNEDTQNMMLSFLDASKAFSFFPTGLIDELLGRPLYGVAHTLYTIHEKNHDIDIEVLAYGIEVNHKAFGKVDTGKLEEHLKQLPHTKREDIFRGYEKLKGRGVLSGTAMDVLQQKIQERYEEWKPDIEKEFSEAVSKQAKEFSKKPSNYRIWSWIAGIIVLSMLGSFIGFFWSLVAAVSTGLFIDYKIKAIIRHKTETKLLASMRKDEQELLTRAGLISG